jgi:hypothetical protein
MGKGLKFLVSVAMSRVHDRMPQQGPAILKHFAFIRFQILKVVVIYEYIGLVHKFVWFLTLPNDLLFTQIVEQSINYVFSIIHDCLPTFGQVFDPMLEEICRFGCEEVEPILELSIIDEGNSMQTAGERAEEMVIQWGKVRRVGLMWKNLPVSFLNGHYCHVCNVWSALSY